MARPRSPYEDDREEPDVNGDGRLRRIEELLTRLEERSKAWDAVLPRVAILESAMNGVHIAIGQLRIKQGVVYVVLAGLGSVVGAVLSSLILRAV